MFTDPDTLTELYEDNRRFIEWHSSTPGMWTVVCPCGCNKPWKKLTVEVYVELATAMEVDLMDAGFMAKFNHHLLNDVLTQ